MVEFATKLIAYSFIGIVGVIGNLVVLLSIPTVTNMPQITRKFIEHLAIIDLIINLVDVPWKIINALRPDLSDDPYAVALIRCKVMPYIAESLTAVLINTLVALTIDRYIAIVHPFTHISNRQYKMMITLIWGFALVFSIPEMLVKHLNETQCELTWPHNSLRNVYYAIDATENCIAPLCIIIFCYVQIWRIVRNRKIPGESIGNERTNERMERDRIKVLKTIFVITMYFVLSGVPLYMAFFVYEFFYRSEANHNQVRDHTIHFWLDWLALTHLFMNPFLYCLMSTHIRNSFKNLLVCGISSAKKKIQQRVNNNHDNKSKSSQRMILTQ